MWYFLALTALSVSSQSQTTRGTMSWRRLHHLVITRLPTDWISVITMGGLGPHSLVVFFQEYCSHKDCGYQAIAHGLNLQRKLSWLEMSWICQFPASVCLYLLQTFALSLGLAPFVLESYYDSWQFKEIMRARVAAVIIVWEHKASMNIHRNKTM